MNIGFVSTRLSGTDGVSLETDKWTQLLHQMGHQVFHCAGELDDDSPGGSEMVPEMHFRHPDAVWVYEHSFDVDEIHPLLHQRIEEMARFLEEKIEEFVRSREIDLLVAENILAIPMHIPLGVAMGRYIQKSGLPTLGHHHDFYWERARFEKNVVQDLLDEYFPPVAPNLFHVVINTPAQKSLRKRRGVDSEIVPNIFDFSRAAPGLDAFNYDLRENLGLTEDHLIILQPTRVVRRKGIELSVALVEELNKPRYRDRLMGKTPVLLITHRAGDEGMGYLEELGELARAKGVDLRYAASRFDDTRHVQPPEESVVPDQLARYDENVYAMRLFHNGRMTQIDEDKRYSIWDAYVHADFVSYPSRYEGFGNAFLESIYFRLPLLVNRYPVYESDIAPLGFDVVEITGNVDEGTVDMVVKAMMDPVRRRRMVEWNYHLARYHFSYEAVRPKMDKFIRWAEKLIPPMVE